MVVRHHSGCVTDACRRADDGRGIGHQVMDSDFVHVLPVRHRMDDVRLRDDAYWPIGLLAVQDHQGGRTRVLHQVRGRGRMVVLVQGRGRWPHNVRVGDGGTLRLRTQPLKACSGGKVSISASASPQTVPTWLRKTAACRSSRVGKCR